MPEVRLDFAKIVHCLALSVMVMLSASSLAAFFSIPVSAAIALIVTYIFGRAVAVAAGVDETVGSARSRRLLAALAALFLGAVTLGLSSTTLYRGSMGKASGVQELARQRQIAIQGLDRALADARAAQAALRGWATSSQAAAAKEAAAGGTCPNRSRTAGARGPVAIYRETDAAIARQTSAGLADTIMPLEAARRAIAGQPARDWQGAVAQLQHLNEAVAAANAIYGSPAVVSAAASLESRLKAPLDGGGSCGDPARDDAIRAARSAIDALITAAKLPEVRPAVDLSSAEASTQRGLLRSMNAAASLVTFGMLGSFADDPLMRNALKNNGVINTETLAIFVALIIEVAVIGSAIMAGIAHHGRKPAFPIDFRSLVTQLRSRPELRWRVAAGAVAGTLNLITVEAGSPSASRRTPPAAGSSKGDGEWIPSPVPVIEPSIIGIAHHILPYIVRGTDRVIVAEDAPAQVLAAVQSLTFRGAAKIRGTFQFDQATDHPLARVAELAPGQRYILLELRAEFAEAVRARFFLSVAEDSRARDYV